MVQIMNSHLQWKVGFVESFQWGEIVVSLSRAIVESLGHVFKGVVRAISEVSLLREVVQQQTVGVVVDRSLGESACVK